MKISYFALICSLAVSICAAGRDRKEIPSEKVGKLSLADSKPQNSDAQSEEKTDADLFHLLNDYFANTVDLTNLDDEDLSNLMKSSPETSEMAKKQVNRIHRILCKSEANTEQQLKKFLESRKQFQNRKKMFQHVLHKPCDPKSETSTPMEILKSNVLKDSEELLVSFVKQDDAESLRGLVDLFAHSDSDWKNIEQMKLKENVRKFVDNSKELSKLYNLANYLTKLESFDNEKKIYSVNYPGFNALLEAAEKRNSLVLDKLISKGIDVDQVDEQGFTALFAAAALGESELVRKLLEAGANVNQAEKKNGYTAFYMAVSLGNTAVVDLLLEAGADVNVKTNGYTALMMAAGHGNEDLVIKLLDKKADFNVKAPDGRTALMMATFRNHHNIVELLKQKGATE